MPFIREVWAETSRKTTSLTFVVSDRCFCQLKTISTYFIRCFFIENQLRPRSSYNHLHVINYNRASSLNFMDKEYVEAFLQFIAQIFKILDLLSANKDGVFLRSILLPELHQLGRILVVLIILS